MKTSKTDLGRQETEKEKKNEEEEFKAREYALEQRKVV